MAEHNTDLFSQPVEFEGRPIDLPLAAASDNLDALLQSIEPQTFEHNGATVQRQEAVWRIGEADLGVRLCMSAINLVGARSRLAVVKAPVELTAYRGAAIKFAWMTNSAGSLLISEQMDVRMEPRSELRNYPYRVPRERILAKRLWSNDRIKLQRLTKNVLEMHRFNSEDAYEDFLCTIDSLLTEKTGMPKLVLPAEGDSHGEA